jgi:hypothetical protein
MAHIHEEIDCTAGILVVRHARVLMMHHRDLGQWPRLGGHIALGISSAAIAPPA